MTLAALVFPCLVCICIGKRLQVTSEQWQHRARRSRLERLYELDLTSSNSRPLSRINQSDAAVRDEGMPNARTAFATLLQKVSPASAFHFVGQGVPSSRERPSTTNLDPVVLDRLKCPDCGVPTVTRMRASREMTMSGDTPGAPASGPPSAAAKASVGQAPVGSPGGGPPGAGPPGSGAPQSGGAPKGGPPPRTPAQQAVDKLFETVFPLLYAFEPQGMLDSEKNLRVLWVRALLAAAGELDDPVAAQLLPVASRWLVSAPLARTVWVPVLPKLEWIKQRTEFIDRALDDFLAANTASESQVVLIGAGYDTRALRYRTSGANFYEVDLPKVNDVKATMMERFCKVNGESSGISGCRTLGVDLNKVTMAPPGVFAELEALGLDRQKPTLVVIEAVLFYLSPPAKRALLADAATFVNANVGSAVVLTDNLAPFVRTPSADDASAFLTPLGLSLQKHDSLWGGAIQFVRADGSGPDATNTIDV